jgi:hypothetical protein
MGQRITGMVSGQARLPIAPSQFGFSPCGRSGMKLGNLLPYTQKIADEICLINRCTPRPSIMIPRLLSPDRQSAARTAQHGFVGGLRLGLGK